MLNQIILIGRLGDDPESHTSGGKHRVRLSIATDRKWTAEDGTKKEDTQWHRVTVWGKQADACANYLGKGRLVNVIGRMQYSKYVKEGVTHYSSEVIADSVKFLDRPPEKDNSRPARDEKPYGRDERPDDQPWPQDDGPDRGPDRDPPPRRDERSEGRRDDRGDRRDRDRDRR